MFSTFYADFCLCPKLVKITTLSYIQSVFLDLFFNGLQIYLYNRKQRVVIPEVTSNWSSVETGVPQGSILGSLLFLLYINDIVESINSFIRLFAGDTTLYIIVDNPLHDANQLNSDLSKIHQRATNWLVTFNPSKFESIIFSRKRNKSNHPNVVMDQQPIQEVNSHKHLGLVLSSDCTRHDLLEYIKSKAWTRINVIRKLKFNSIEDLFN